LNVPARARRTQAERSAETRARVLEAAVQCLFTRGYAATTTLLVAQEAGLSRGAMLHQFPTKTDLMLYTVRAVFDAEMEIYSERLKAIPDQAERMLSMPEMIWEVLSRPSGVAVLEILQGSRSDPVLAERLAPLQAQIERESFAYTSRLQERLGEVASPAMTRLVHWAIRGLSVAQLLTQDPAEILESVRLLRRMMAAFAAETQAGEGAGPGSG
jgi:AcrR family transcriptional regulator